MKICKICGKPFETNLSTKICCSPECARERKRLYSKAYRAGIRAPRKSVPKKREVTENMARFFYRFAQLIANDGKYYI
jgi:hypothetical protein